MPNKKISARPANDRTEKSSDNEYSRYNQPASAGAAVGHTQRGPTAFANDHLDEQELLRVLTEVKNGNFDVRMPIDQVGLSGKICDTLNDIISLNEKMMHGIHKGG